MAQAVVCRHLTTEAWVLSHVVPCEFYDGKSTTEIDINWLLRYYFPNIITLFLLINLYIYCIFYVYNFSNDDILHTY